MKTAVLYQRVSSDEQAHGHSLKDQRVRLEEYCQRLGIVIIGNFVDDYTGKTFDRPGFNQLLKFAKERKPQEVLFIKWSRFSRNTADAYMMIRKLKGMGADVQAIDEPIDFAIPQSKIMLAIHLANPEVENDIRSDLTTRGLRRAAKEGRHTNGAPFGYINQRDENRKAIIVIQPERAALIKQAFEEMATGERSQNEVRLSLYKQGLRLSKSRFSLAMQNPVYCGMVRVRAYKGDKEEIVKGIHKPVISESLFYKVQDVLSGRRRNEKKKRRIQASEDFPLKGVLHCHAHHKMLGSKSRGRREMYSYYHCSNELHCTRYQANKVNNSFADYLQGISEEGETSGDVRAVIEYLVKPDEKEVQGITVKIQVQEQRILKLQDSFIDGHINAQDYRQMRARYEGELYDLKTALAFISTKESDLLLDLKCAMGFLYDLPELYRKSGAEKKKDIIGSIIHGRLYFDGENCRTDLLNPLVTLYTKPDAAFSDFYELKNSGISGHVPFSRVEGTQSRTISLYKSIRQLAQTYKLLRA